MQKKNRQTPIDTLSRGISRPDLSALKNGDIARKTKKLSNVTRLAKSEMKFASVRETIGKRLASLGRRGPSLSTDMSRDARRSVLTSEESLSRLGDVPRMDSWVRHCKQCGDDSHKAHDPQLFSRSDVLCECRQMHSYVMPAANTVVEEGIARATSVRRGL